MSREDRLWWYVFSKLYLSIQIVTFHMAMSMSSASGAIGPVVDCFFAGWRCGRRVCGRRYRGGDISGWVRDGLMSALDVWAKCIPRGRSP